MSSRLFSFIVFAMIVFNAINAQVWRDLVVHTCSNELHWMPSNPIFNFATDLGKMGATTAIESIIQSAREHAECYCPSLTTQQLDDSNTLNFANVIRALSQADNNFAVSKGEPSRLCPPSVIRTAAALTVISFFLFSCSGSTFNASRIPIDKSV